MLIPCDVAITVAIEVGEALVVSCGVLLDLGGAVVSDPDGPVETKKSTRLSRKEEYKMVH